MFVKNAELGIRLSEKTESDRIDKLLALIARAGSEGKKQAAAQAISRLITTHPKTVIRECTFVFPDYGALCLFQTVGKHTALKPIPTMA